MRKLVLTAALVLALLATGLPGAAQTPFRPVATVNESVITAWDVDQRVRLLRALGVGGGQERNIANRALDRLIENRLMLQEGARRGITPSEEMIREGIAEFAARGDLSAQQFRARLEEAGVSEQALADAVGAQMVWRRVVRARFRDQVSPGEAEIDAEISLAGERRAEAYRLSEIGLPFNDRGRSEAETRALAERLYAQLSDGGDFRAAVGRYSRAPSASEGGDVGWVPSDALPPPLVQAISGLEPGEVTRPLEVQGGISILRLEARRETAAAELDPADAELRERVRRDLVSQRLELLAEGLLQELRRDALIEIR